MFQDKKSKWFRFGLIFFILIVSLFFISCHLYSGNNKAEDSKKDEFVAHIRQPEDLRKLDKIETILTVTPEKAIHHPDYQIVEQVAVPFIPEYRMGAGDVIEIVYHISYDDPIEFYLLAIQDKISINFPYHPQFSSTVLIRTDGKITLPLIGDVLAEGKAPEDLAKTLNQKYNVYLNEPSITIALEEFNVKIRELKRAITTAPRGQSKIAPVTPDGRVSFPIIGSLHVAGLTVDQVEKIVNEKYKRFVENLQSTIILLEIHQPRFYIFGQVNRPGTYDMAADMNLSLLDALALSGGHTTTANLKEVLVMRNEGLEKPIAFKVDVASILKTGNVHPNLRLKAGDIVFVPKGKLDEFNDLMDKIFTKGIWTILPFTSSYSWNYRIDGTKGVSGQ